MQYMLNFGNEGAVLNPNPLLGYFSSGNDSSFQQRLRVYVGCSLTSASEALVREVREFKVTLQNQGFEVLDFLGLSAGTPRDVWNWDIAQCVMSCHMMVAVCDEPSIGLGVELGTMLMHRQAPVIAVAKPKSKVTRLILDPHVPGRSTFTRQEKLTDLLPLIENEAAMIRSQFVDRVPPPPFASLDSRRAPYSLQGLAMVA